MFRLYFGNYCKKTTLHGFPYLAHPNRSIVERVWWILSISIAIICISYLIVATYLKWVYKPWIFAFGNTIDHVSTIPFPAVTFCSFQKIHESHLSFIDTLNQLKATNASDKNQLKEFNKYALLCPYRGEEAKKFYKLGKKTMSDKELGDVLGNMFYQFWFSTVLFGGTSVYDAYKAAVIPTEEGLCYSFNLNKKTDIYHEGVFYNQYLQEYNYVHNSTNQNNFYSYSKGEENGLNNLLVLLTNTFDLLCSNGQRGFKVIFGSPFEQPSTYLPNYKVNPEDISHLAIVPKISILSEDMSSVGIEQRQCYYPEERQLKYFKVYSKSNCLLECLANASLLNCKCVPFYVPRYHGTSICGMGSFECVDKVKDQVYQGKNRNHGCNCLEPCYSIRYYVNLKSSYLFFKEYMQYDVKQRNSSYSHVAEIRAYFRDSYFIPTIRKTLFTVMDFIGYCGGIFSLFLGFSLFSLIEIVYYISKPLIGKIFKGKFFQRN